MSVTRLHPGARMSAAVIHGDTVYLSGVVARDLTADVHGQTEQILYRIDELLAEAGSGRSRLLSATVWLRDISTFEEMNKAWVAWVDPGNPPTRATVEARLAHPDYRVEIMVVAAR
jgi:enamine deaminase RidA (YjgF/YER057c/UK114 family)